MQTYLVLHSIICINIHIHGRYYLHSFRWQKCLTINPHSLIFIDSKADVILERSFSSVIFLAILRLAEYGVSMQYLPAIVTCVVKDTPLITSFFLNDLY